MNDNELISFSSGQFSSVDSQKCIVSLGDNEVKYLSPSDQVEGREVLFSLGTRSPFAGAEAEYKTPEVWLPELNNQSTYVSFDVNLSGATASTIPKLFRAHVERTLTPGSEGSWELYERLGVLVHSSSITAYLHVRKREPASWWRIRAVFPDQYYEDCWQHLTWAVYNRPVSS